MFLAILFSLNVPTVCWNRMLARVVNQRGQSNHHGPCFSLIDRERFADSQTICLEFSDNSPNS